LESGEHSKRDNKDAGIQLGEFVSTRAQLCGMFAAGYSAKMTEKNQQGISVFENFAESDLFTFNGLQGEVGGGGVVFEFQVSGSRCQVMFCPNESLNDGDEDQQGKDRKQNGDICG